MALSQTTRATRLEIVTKETAPGIGIGIWGAILMVTIPAPSAVLIISLNARQLFHY
ncbi:hypothetical protein BDV39DRAFT_176108 [Aspergillus sergii]|uniref:Uncharacterized protein n=1 Tax=Aspergillus sergii TaxID=1034303 RepID=A0A5N6X2E3_9EURO|nr:hypothetical protein BDV39DRAFT_176108 [Aspergillus sergii]